MDSIPSPAQLAADGVLENMKWIDKILGVGVSFALIVALLKILHQADVEWAGIDLPVNHAWLVFLGLSVGHVYCTWLTLRSILALWRSGDPQIRSYTFSSVVARHGLFVRGMVPRIHPLQDRGRRTYLMHYDDPSALVAYGSATLLFFAIVPFHSVRSRDFFLLAVLAFFLVQLNWRLGSSWAVALSELTIPDRFPPDTKDFFRGERLLALSGYPMDVGQMSKPLVGCSIILVALLVSISSAILDVPARHVVLRIWGILLLLGCALAAAGGVDDGDGGLRASIVRSLVYSLVAGAVWLAVMSP